MNTLETISTWKWRIKRAGLTLSDFSNQLDISPSLFSDYCNFKKNPSLFRFQMIEDALRELEG